MFKLDERKVPKSEEISNWKDEQERKQEQYKHKGKTIRMKVWTAKINWWYQVCSMTSSHLLSNEIVIYKVSEGTEFVFQTYQ